MKSQFDANNLCPCCGRHCPSDNLHCQCGMAYFGQETEHSKHAGRQGGSIKDETVMLMLQCGHMLHHGLRERAESEDILHFLSQEEKKTLTVILTKCVSEWNSK